MTVVLVTFRIALTTVIAIWATAGDLLLGCLRGSPCAYGGEAMSPAFFYPYYVGTFMLAGLNAGIFDREIMGKRLARGSARKYFRLCTALLSAFPLCPAAVWLQNVAQTGRISADPATAILFAVILAAKGTLWRFSWEAVQTQLAQI